jgi:hypothetical protein
MNEVRNPQKNSLKKETLKKMNEVILKNTQRLQQQAISSLKKVSSAIK